MKRRKKLVRFGRKWPGCEEKAMAMAEDDLLDLLREMKMDQEGGEHDLGPSGQ